MDTIQEHFNDVNLNAYDSFPCKKTSAFGVSELVLRETVVIQGVSKVRSHISHANEAYKNRPKV